MRYTWRRYLQGTAQLEADRRFGRWIAREIPSNLASCYLFTQLALEVLPRLRREGVRHVLDNPNGHIRHYREVVQQEAANWLPTSYPGHPTRGMVERVEEEYALAGRIRVASTWAAQSLISRGVDPGRLAIIPHAVDLTRFRPGSRPLSAPGKVRVLFVGRMTLSKGFHHLLLAVKRLRTSSISVMFVGATGDPWCRRMFQQLSRDLDVHVAPGDPVPAYHQADLLVLPTLHDGFGLVVAEAMAAGLPVITTTNCGASEHIRPGVSGWVVPAGDVGALAGALEDAVRRRQELREMGHYGRQDVERACGELAINRLRGFITSEFLENGRSESCAS